MQANTDISVKLSDMLDLARLAPSVHNTQPWLVGIPQKNVVRIVFDTRYKLQDGDPTGRESTISLGIFAEALSIAANQYAFTVSETQLLDDGGGVDIHFKPYAQSPIRYTKDLVQLMRLRCSDRSIYRPAHINDESSKAIVGSFGHGSATIHLITAGDDIEKIAQLTARGIRTALSNPSFRRELGKYLVPPWSHKKRGIAVSSLYVPKLLATCEPALIRLGIGLDAEAALEKRRWESASGVVAITTNGDMPKHWFEAGRAYLNASLAIERLGFAQATSAATVEASNYHEDIEAMIHTGQRLQAMIRIGLGSPKKHFSPRAEVASLLAT